MEPYLLLIIRLAFLCLLSMVCNALTPLHTSRLEYMLSRTGNNLILFIYLFALRGPAHFCFFINK